MDIFTLELVPNQLTVPVKIDGRQQQNETSRAIEKPGINAYTRRTSVGFRVPYLQGNLRSWVAWCLMDIFTLELVPNQYR